MSSVLDTARLDRWLARQERERRQFHKPIPDGYMRGYVLGQAHAYAKVRAYVQQQGMKRKQATRVGGSKVTRRPRATASGNKQRA